MDADTRSSGVDARRADGGEPVSMRSLEAALSHATRLYHDNEYERLARVLPRLIDDANPAPPLLRSRTLQLAGSVMVQTRQPDSARIALNQSLTDAESTGNVLDAASAVTTLCWLLIVERQFEAVRHLATRWADRVEARLSVATTRELSTWGWLLLRASAAAVRDNRPDEADEMMRLAAAGAVARPLSPVLDDFRPSHRGHEAGRECRGGRPPGRRVAPGPRYTAGPAADVGQPESTPDRRIGGPRGTTPL
ncbi:hypothetical protein [Nocardia abscessus]|uniref:hypothetical protein n=1 Tax=Nocardia abscessus TaxID=120957 RepID=UPI00030AA20C|nr:hypothetical protein [Nocardia abscessus]MCC3330123.1 hypothetical protein [Nocardia abscessus]